MNESVHLAFSLYELWELGMGVSPIVLGGICPDVTQENNLSTISLSSHTFNMMMIPTHSVL